MQAPEFLCFEICKDSRINMNDNKNKWIPWIVFGVEYQIKYYYNIASCVDDYA